MIKSRRRIVLKRRPVGKPSPDDLALLEEPIPTLEDGQVLVRTIYLSLDPYMRGRMNDAPSYTQPVALGEVMVGETVGVVEASRVRALSEGTFVRCPGGWQSHSVHAAGEVTPLDPTTAPISTALGVLGMPGLTAYAGLKEIGRPKQGETLVVAAATGPVGSLVGQLARRQGLRAVGVAGGSKKCRLAVEEFGFDACLDHRGDDLEAELEAASPDGIDIYFELVGGAVLQAVLPRLNVGARVPVVGTIAHYNAKSLPEGPDRTALLMRTILVNRLTLKGLIVFDHEQLRPEFEGTVGPMVRAGEVRYLEDVAVGLESAPEAFIGLLQGRNRGKQLVRVSDEATPAY